MIITSKVWKRNEEASLLSRRSHAQSVGDKITCERFEYEIRNAQVPLETTDFKVTVGEIREMLTLLYNFEESLVSDDYGTSFTITGLKNFQSEVLPNIKEYNPTFYQEVVRKPNGVVSDFVKAQLDKLEQRF